jgi:3-oxoacyl-[acyl-carrier protein] reductase
MSADLFTLEGKTALVTGASGGIGAAIARTLHGLGAQVTLSGTREAALTALAAELGARSYVLAADLADPKAADALITGAEAAMGKVDILVNNAGLTRDGLTLRMSDEAWAQVLDVDLAAPFRLSRAALKFMMRRRYGRIINIGSIVGSTGNPGQVNYASAKAGLIGLTKALAQEVASRNITINLVAPGFIETAMTDALTEEQRLALSGKIPLGRLGQPADVAAAVAYLASDAAGWVTGSVLHVNGGMAMI